MKILFTATMIALLAVACGEAPDPTQPPATCAAEGPGSIQCTATFEDCVGTTSCNIPSLGTTFNADGTYQQTYADGTQGSGTWRVNRQFNPAQVLITNQAGFTASFALYEFTWR